MDSFAVQAGKAFTPKLIIFLLCQKDGECVN
ncbi:hypothetical protein EGR_00923 [Echinococcus granulosus]|uniref:Uncharacterized protein n=1 Tax=Echinococcus granulosus TaxID=6210 RepID=W6VC00_ECHGR|nr:hypothetical protein EGR_00923 [Echinococcus granulosus]EUB64379.1 hypothetical protein EGR_00923 [Echinococcus granulosus]